MFLFSTPSARETTPANPVVSAIKQGADRTGVGFDYLLKTAQRESALEPEAKARTSSATGLFQFIEQTWLSIMRQEGPKQGMANYAGAISEGESGRLTVSDPAMREKILQLRNDPQIAAVMAGALTQKNSEQLGAALGRQPHAGELYIAHVLGARGASDLIRTAASDPSRTAARDFPEAAAANKAIFFDKSGRARSAQEVYGLLAASHANTQVAASTGAMLAQARPSATTATAYASEPPVAPIAAALAPGRAKGLIGLFSTEGPRTPVSKAVANLWTTPRGDGASRLANSDPATRYFPREGARATSQSETAAADSGKAEKPQADAAALTITVRAPLPPARPRELSASELQAVAKTTTETGKATAATTTTKARRGPLDLSSFMTHGRRG